MELSLTGKTHPKYNVFFYLTANINLLVSVVGGESETKPTNRSL